MEPDDTALRLRDLDRRIDERHNQGSDKPELMLIARGIALLCYLLMPGELDGR